VFAAGSFKIEKGYRKYSTNGGGLFKSDRSSDPLGHSLHSMFRAISRMSTI